ncbi:MAG: hypothetical protein ACLQVN_14485 [Bryobacteraceae bacterium]
MVLAGWKGWLYLLVGVWAYYHVIRQHYGFMVLYKVKNRDLAPVDNRLDRVFLGVMLVYPPFQRFFIRHPEELGLHFRLSGIETPVWCVVAGEELDEIQFLPHMHRRHFGQERRCHHHGDRHRPE